MRRLPLYTLLFLWLLIGPRHVMAQEAPVTAYNSMPFGMWVELFKKDALAQGISQATLDAALPLMSPDEAVVRFDRKQPESTITFGQYKRNTLPQSRIDKARELYAENRELLESVAKRYDVPAKYIVALWGMESSFGANMGNYSVVQSLATLAYEGRRAEFFRTELIKSLQIIQEQQMYPGDLIGSWAGAMGQCQFMPSSYQRFAVDGDNDGKKDIWNSQADVFASIANYLHSEGWKEDESWGREVTLPPGFDMSLENIENFRPLSEWSRLGVRTADGSPLPKANIKAALIYGNRTSTEDGVYLIYPNYNVILTWNRSRYFGTAVGLLADATVQ